jgi:hypothetical protein
MGAFIIINAASNNARMQMERDELERKREKKMRALGYVQKSVLINPSTRYKHEFRNIEKRTTGIILIMVAFSIIAVVLSVLFNNASISNYWLIPTALSCVLLFVGGNKINNTVDVYSSENIPAENPGHYFVKTSDKAIYKDEWVKKDDLLKSVKKKK